ncbi:hypothetical protein SUFG_00072 [Sulfitobacter phage phiCB2047-B]|uniref:Uncharacterized protein n=1 Tax=Sulfitobacter phage phiCB2047-B TaxID=754046 RepID=M4PYK1_9CAUD|nr:hypothetical protein SUFG_00072 [Sulfitobacter phage phiCB2047-B]AGH07439.1 hypothetical protein SUFG_00072 [Sulfitobacter phage phiCB2047-B]
MQKTLMLERDGQLPFAYQVPEPVYEEFKHYQGIKLASPHSVIAMIDASCILHLRRLEQSIDEWKTKSIKEIQAYDRHKNLRN